MTLQEAKDQAAQKHGYTDFDEFMYLGVTGDAMDDISAIYETAMERYAEAKAKEAYNQGVRDAAESAEATFDYMEYDEVRFPNEKSIIVNKDSILKLLK